MILGFVLGDWIIDRDWTNEAGLSGKPKAKMPLADVAGFTQMAKEFNQAVATCDHQIASPENLHDNYNELRLRTKPAMLSAGVCEFAQ